MRGATIIIQQQTSSTKENKTVELKEKEAKDFLEVMKKYVLNETKINITSTYGNLNEMDPKILPSMGVVDLTKGNEDKISQKSGDFKDSQDGMDFGISDIKLSQLHDSYMGQNPNRVFLLGDVGGGKTTAAKLYARMVLNGEVESLKDIELVHFISISDLQQTRTTAFDLLVSQQVGLNKKTEECGEKWLAKNASKTLFVLDGLDQSAKDLSGRIPKVAKLNAEASTNGILANILSGVLYPGLNILVTSRQNAFWKLERKLRSSKTVVLRGFDDQNLKDAAVTLAGENEGDKIIAALRETSLLSLCRNPMFLIYAIEVFKQDMDNPPDTMTALMSGVLKLFEGSDNWNDNFETLTKLAYHATIDNRYRFTENYVRNIGINPLKLGGILTPHTRLLRYQSHPATGDTTWSFPHQSLQEFLGALGIFDGSQDKFNRFVENELNMAELQIVRKFVYGMVLNPATRQFRETYLTDKSVSLGACKKTLMKQLDRFLAKGVIDDINVISLLHECGPNVISHYKSRINRISTNEEFLKPEDEHSLMSVTKQCVPMKEVRIKRMELNPMIVEQIRGFIDKVENFQISTMTVGKHIMTQHCRELTDLVPKIKVKHINLWTTENIASTLIQTWIDDKKAPCKSFSLKQQFSNDTFRKTGRFLSELGADYLCFNQCRLTKEKFKVLCDSMEKGAKLSKFCICDEAAMAPEVYEDLTMCLNKGCVKVLILRKCGLTVEKLASLNNGIDRNKVKLNVLKLRDDPTMKPEAYHSLACAIGKACVRALTLGNNEITDAKLQALEDGATKSYVKLYKLKIFGEANMTPCTYRRLANTVGKTHVQTLVLQNNEVSAEKIQEFGEAAKVGKVKFEKLWILDEVNMTPRTYHRLASTIGKTYVQTLVLQSNEVTAEKIQEFGKAAKVDKVKLEDMSIWNDPMDAAGLREFAKTIKTVNANIVALGCCQPTAEKLRSFKQSIKQNNVKFKMLEIYNNEDLDDECYNEIVEICKDVNADLKLSRWNVPDDRVRMLKMHIRNVIVKP